MWLFSNALGWKPEDGVEGFLHQSLTDQLNEEGN